MPGDPAATRELIGRGRESLEVKRVAGSEPTEFEPALSPPIFGTRCAHCHTAAIGAEPNCQRMPATGTASTGGSPAYEHASITSRPVVTLKPSTPIVDPEFEAAP